MYKTTTITLFIGVFLTSLCTLASKGIGWQQPVDISQWNAKPGWVAKKAKSFKVEKLEAVNRFSVATPSGEMKWIINLNDLSLEKYRYLIFTYRAQNYNSAPGNDFALHLQVKKPVGENRFLVKRDGIIADRKWHTMKFDLEDAAMGKIAKTLVLHVLANKNGNAALDVKELYFTSKCPSELLNRKVKAQKQFIPVRAGKALQLKHQGEVGWKLPEKSAASWKPHPGWVGRPSKKFRVVNKNDLLVFVCEKGTQMKWSLPLHRVAVDEYRYLVITYRSWNYNNAPGDDFFLYVTATRADGKQKWAVKRSDVKSNGKWQTVVCDMRNITSGGTASQLVLHLLSSRKAAGVVDVKTIYFATQPPKGIKMPESKKKGGTPKVLFDFNIREKCDIVQRRPSEVKYPTVDRNASYELTSSTVKFKIPSASTVMEWNCIPDIPFKCPKNSVVEMRYRAKSMDEKKRGIVWLGWDLINATDPVYLLPITFNTFKANGCWQIARGPVPEKVSRCWTIGILGRSSANGNGELELDYVRILDRMPAPKLSDFIQYRPATNSRPDWIALPLNCNISHASDLGRLMSPNSWFKNRKVQINGIPFQLTKAGKNLLGSGVKQRQELKVDVNKSNVKEIYLLLGAKFVGDEAPPLGHGLLRKIREPERFLVKVNYEDGNTESFFPVNVMGKEHAIDHGIGIYAIIPNSTKRIKNIVLCDQMDNGAFFLAGATANLGKAEIARDIHINKNWYKMQAAQVPAVKGFNLDAGKLELRNAFYSFCLDRKNPLLIKKWYNKITNKNQIAVSSACKLIECPGENFKVKKINTTVDSICLTVKSQQFAGEISISGKAGSSEILLNASMRYIGKSQKFIPELQLPAIKGLQGGSNTWWFYPEIGKLASNTNTEFHKFYSGTFPFQIMGLFCPENGGGCYLMGKDKENRAKFFGLKKSKTTAGLFLTYPKGLLKNGDKLTLAPVALGVNAGDWKNQARAYKNWLYTWLQPRKPFKNWFQQTFYNYEICAHHSYYQVFDAKTKKFLLDESLKTFRKTFGGVDMFHFYDFGITKNGRVGDYDDYSKLGGLNNLRKFISAAEKDHINTSLYVEGNLTAYRSNWIKANTDAGQRRGPTGAKLFYPGTRNQELFMCPFFSKWHQHLDSLAGRLLKETGARALYLDEYGYCGYERACYSRKHGHPVPGWAHRGQAAITRSISNTLKAQNKDLSVYSEANPNDYNSQFEDGSLSSILSCWRENFNVPRINIYRYFLPHFKSFQMNALHKYVADGYSPYKIALFNGDGIFLGENPEADYSDTAHDWLKKAYKVIDKHRELFSSLDFQPGVPTLKAGIFANAFKHGNKTLYTLFNTNWQTVSGAVLKLDFNKSVEVKGIWGDPVLQKTNGSKKILINTSIEPRSITCFIVECK